MFNINIYRCAFFCIIISLIFNFAFGNICFAQDYTVSSSTELSITSPSAILMESNTGTVIYEKNADEIRPIASLTKILTAIITIENCDLNEYATASHYATTSLPSGYSIADIKEGESLSISDLLDVLLVHSANDAAIVLAEYVSGSEEKFADLMNQKAKELNCTNSHFVNSNGKEQENHYSTSRDMAIIMNYCMQNEVFRQKASQKTASLPKTDYSEERNFQTTVQILLEPTDGSSNPYYYPYIVAGKTGYTSNAGNCLVSYAKKGDLELVSVILGSGKTSSGESIRFYETQDIYEYGFNNYTYTNYKSSCDVIGQIEINNGSANSISVYVKDDIPVLLRTDEDKNEIEQQIYITKKQAPIYEDEKVGTITYTINGVDYTADLYSSDYVEEVVNVSTLDESSYTYSSSNTLQTVLLVLIIVVILVIVVLFYFANKNKMDTSFTPQKLESKYKQPKLSKKEQKQKQQELDNLAITQSLDNAISISSNKKVETVTKPPIKKFAYNKQMLYLQKTKTNKQKQVKQETNIEKAQIKQEQNNNKNLDIKPEDKSLEEVENQIPLVLNQVISFINNSNKHNNKNTSKIQESSSEKMVKAQSTTVIKEPKEKVKTETKTKAKDDIKPTKTKQQKTSEPKVEIINETKQKEAVKEKTKKSKEQIEQLPIDNIEEKDEETIEIDVKKLKENKAKNKEAIEAIKKLKQIETENEKAKKQKEEEEKKKQLSKLKNKIAKENTQENIDQIQSTDSTKPRKTKNQISKQKKQNITENKDLIDEIKSKKN